MHRRKNGPTMKDVAQEAGVALGTVSKVINGAPVGEDYRLRVEAAIEKLGYRVNQVARSLRAERTRLIEVMVPNLVNPYFCRLVDCLSRELTRRGYRMLLCATDYDPDREQAQMLAAEQQMVDGIICLSYNPDLTVPERVPLISIDRSFGANVPCVASDNFSGGRLAAQTLAANGCTNLAFLKIGTRLANEPNKRKDGFVSACEEMGLPYTLKILDDETPYAVFEEFLREHLHGGRLDLDGIFCATDSLAYQIVRTLRAMGQAVPEQVQVIGFDGARCFGDQELHCSTIVQPVEAIAEACVTMLLEKHLEKVPYLLCLPVQYAPGGTTKQ